MPLDTDQYYIGKGGSKTSSIQVDIIGVGGNHSHTHKNNITFYLYETAELEGDLSLFLQISMPQGHEGTNGPFLDEEFSDNDEFQNEHNMLQNEVLVAAMTNKLEGQTPSPNGPIEELLQTLKACLLSDDSPGDALKVGKILTTALTTYFLICLVMMVGYSSNVILCRRDCMASPWVQAMFWGMTTCTIYPQAVLLC